MDESLPQSALIQSTHLKEGVMAEMEAVAIQSLIQKTRIINLERNALKENLLTRKIDQYDTRSSPPIDEAMQETLLHVFDVMVYYSFLKHAISQKFCIDNDKYSESRDGQRLSIKLHNILEDMHLTPCLAAIRATPQFMKAFETETEGRKNSRAYAFLGPAIGYAINALESCGKNIDINDTFGDFRRPQDTRITSSDLAGNGNTSLESLRSSILNSLNQTAL